MQVVGPVGKAVHTRTELAHCVGEGKMWQVDLAVCQNLHGRLQESRYLKLLRVVAAEKKTMQSGTRRGLRIV